MEEYMLYTVSGDYQIEVGHEDDIVYLRLLSVDDTEASMSAEFEKDAFHLFLEMLTNWFNSLEAE